MAGLERTVKCSECGTERTTRAGTGTALKCAKGHIFRAPAPAAETPSPPAPGSRVKRAKAGQTVVRQNARPRPKKNSPPAGDTPPTPPAPAATSEETPPPGGDPPPGPAPKPKNPPGGDPDEQRRFGRRGGLAYYQRLVRKAS